MKTRTNDTNGWLDRPLGRRQVLKGMGALGAAALVGRGVAMSADPIGTHFDSYTRLSAAHWGTFHATVERGRLTNAIPWQEEQYPSPMVQAMPDLLYSPTRIRYPMVRSGFLQNRENSDPTGRGKEPFVRVSWDDALDLVAEQLERVKDEYGNNAIYGASYGWDCAGRLNLPSFLLRRMLGLFGGYTYYVNTYSSPVGPVISPHVVGTSSPASSAWPALIENSNLFVFFGYNPLATADISYGGTGNNRNFYWLSKLKESGKPIVSFNPIREATDIYLETEHIAIRANTDTALMLALAHVLYSEGLHDQAFLDRYTVGFDTFAEYLTGASDGQPKTPEWAEPITGIPADTIRGLARRMAEGPTVFYGAHSLQRAEHGAQPWWMMITLSAMLGHIGQPGGGLNVGFAPGLGVPRGNAPSVPFVAGAPNPVRDFVPVNMWTDMVLNPGETIDYNGQRLTYPDIRMLMFAGANPLHHAHDTNRVLQAWQRPEVVVVNDHSWTATAKHADIVLPATTTMERNDITADSYHIIAMKQAVEPLFEARNDRDIYAGIAARLGLEDEFTEGKNEMEYLRHIYDVAKGQGEARGLDMPDFDTFWEREYLAFDEAPGARDSVGYRDFVADPSVNPLGTPSGRIEIYSQTIASFDYDDCPPHPTWLEPSEWHGGELAQTYPLHVLTRHSKYRLHSQLNNTFIRNWYEVKGREPVWINPQDAAARGIEDGDVVRVYNDRGAVLAGAWVTDRMRPGVITIPQGSWYDPVEPGQVGSLCKHGNVNMITTDKGDSKLSQGNPSNTMLAEVEKYTEALPPITAFDPPA